MRKINKIIVHCTATPEGRSVTVKDVDKWHRQRGWRKIGYHYLVGLNGEIHEGRKEWEVGAHTFGYNQHSIGVAYVGGLTKSGKPADTRTPEQRKSLIKLIRELKSRYHGAKVYGHRDFANKECPCFDARKEYINL